MFLGKFPPNDFLGTAQSAAKPIFPARQKPCSMVAQDLFVKLLDLIPEERVSVHQLTCKTGLDHRTIKKYLDLIIQIQNSKKIVKEQVGLRVLVRREK